MKVWNYVYMGLTMIILMEFIGFPTAISGVFDFLNLNFSNGTLLGANIDSSGIKDYFLGTGAGFLTTIAAVGVATGLFIAGKADIAIKAAFATAVLTGFLTSLYYPLQYAISNNFAPWITAILGLIFIPFTVGYFIALAYFVFGGASD